MNARSLLTRTAFVAAIVLIASSGVRLTKYLVLAPGRATLAEQGLTADPRPTLLVVFQPADCPQFGRFIMGWNALARTGEVQVLGVPLHRSGDAQLKARPVLRGVDFPLRPELAAAVETLLLRMGYTRTPLAILLDPRGRPRLVVPAQVGEHAFLGAIDVVRTHVPAEPGIYRDAP